jgi:hypothetical protein
MSIPIKDEDPDKDLTVCQIVNRELKRKIPKIAAYIIKDDSKTLLGTVSRIRQLGVKNEVLVDIFREQFFNGLEFTHPHIPTTLTGEIATGQWVGLCTTYGHMTKKEFVETI